MLIRNESGQTISADEVAGRTPEPPKRGTPAIQPSMASSDMTRPKLIPARAPYLLAFEYQMPRTTTGKMVLPAMAKAMATIWAISAGGLRAVMITTKHRTTVKRRPTSSDSSSVQSGLKTVEYQSWAMAEAPATSRPATVDRPAARAPEAR